MTIFLSSCLLIKIYIYCSIQQDKSKEKTRYPLTNISFHLGYLFYLIQEVKNNENCQP
nr:MAG TPA: hypothetical protein [Caudoviricetes sp.]